MGRRKRSFSAEEGGKLELRKSSLHMENQERAYTAASRRTDRSIEARYQSALLASEVHKKRTGKALRITHEIVAKEDMYEEEDNLLSQSWRSSPERKERTAMSQTDAFITALIARKAGVPNSLQQNQVLFATHPPAAYKPANNDDATQPLQHEPELDLLEDNLKYLDELIAIDTLQPIGDQSTVTEPTFLDAPLSYDATPKEHKLPITSFLSDVSSYDSNFSFQMNSDGGSSTGAYSLQLEDCLVDFDWESFLNFSQNSEVVG